MKKSIMGLFLTIAVTSTSNAMMAPEYRQLRVLDAAVEEMATNYFNFEDADEAPIAAIKTEANGDVSVTINNTVCLVALKAKPLPPGAAGTPGIIAKIKECGVIREDLKTVTYEKVMAKMRAAAQLGKIVLGVDITKKGSIKLTVKK